MEATGGIIAIVQISAKIISICGKYALEVKDAKEDIKRLQKEVVSLQESLELVQNSLAAPGGTTLAGAAEALADIIGGCSKELESLQMRLQPKRRQRMKNWLKFAELTWPLTSREVDKLVGVLERRKSSISMLLGASNKMDLLVRHLWNLC